MCYNKVSKYQIVASWLRLAKYMIKRHSVRSLSRRSAALLAIFGLMVGMNIGSIQEATAAQITPAKVTMSNLNASGTGTLAFAFTTITSLSATNTIKLQFDPTGDLFTLASVADTDFSAVSGMTIVNACGGGSDEVTVTSDTSAPDESYTLTVCSGDTVGAGAKAFTIATAKVTNPATPAAYKIAITTTSDSATIAIPVITNDVVNVSATVDPSITFSISDVTVGFGTLASGAVRYATGDTLGGTTETTAAHTMSAGTNAVSGLAVTYSGGLLTSGGNTISAATSVTPPGNTAAEQFAIAVDDNGTAFTIAAGYDQATPIYSYVGTGTTTALFSSAGPLSSTNVDVHYLANIAANTEAGNYSTNITYIATATY